MYACTWVQSLSIAEEDGHLARLADHAVALEADAGDVVAGAVAVVHHLALLLAAIHELDLAHLAVLAGLVLSPLLLSGVRRHVHGPVVAKGAELALLLLGILPSPMGKVGLEEDLVGGSNGGACPAVCSTPPGSRSGPRREGSRRKKHFLGQLLGQRMGCGPKTPMGLSSPTAGAGGSWFIAAPGPKKEEVDVLDAADELARVLQVLVLRPLQHRDRSPEPEPAAGHRHRVKGDNLDISVNSVSATGDWLTLVGGSSGTRIQDNENNTLFSMTTAEAPSTRPAGLTRVCTPQQ